MDKKQAAILKLDIRSFDVASRTVTFDFELKRDYYRGELIGTRRFLQEGNAIIIVEDNFISEENRTLEKMREATKIVWYWPDDSDDSNYRDTDEGFKDKLRRVAYDTIWKIKMSLENWR